MTCKFKVGDYVFTGEGPEGYYPKYKDYPHIIEDIISVAGGNYDMKLVRVNKRTLAPLKRYITHWCYECNARLYTKPTQNIKEVMVLRKIQELDQRFKDRLHVKV